eukprot:TRINITY_DN2397_c0_g1_i4.p1 TRINITY_DN2397_c0_g1~~TRINITY_DN2397_c0_g1_i4.p1  ORF type:complete len:479 (-),score=107.63 TRINITY_DN2397_c0_g1_i4:644-2080(-)
MWGPSDVVPEHRRIANAAWLFLVAGFLVYSCISMLAAINAPRAISVTQQNPADERSTNFSAPSISICIEGNVGCATSVYGGRWTTDDCLESSLKYHAKVGYRGLFTEAHASNQMTYHELSLIRNGSEIGQNSLPTQADQMSCWVVDTSEWEYQSGFSMDILAVWDTNWNEAKYAVQARANATLFQRVADVWIWQGVYARDGSSIAGTGSARKLAPLPLTIFRGPYGTGINSAIDYTSSTYQLTRSRLKYANGSYAMFYNGVVSTGSRYADLYLKDYDEDADGKHLGPAARPEPYMLDNVAIAKIYISLDPGIYTMFYEVDPNWFTIASTVYGLWPAVLAVFGLLFTTRIASRRYLVCKGPKEQLLTPRAVHRTRAVATEFGLGRDDSSLERNWFKDTRVKLSTMSVRKSLVRESAQPQLKRGSGSTSSAMTMPTLVRIPSQGMSDCVHESDTTVDESLPEAAAESASKAPLRALFRAV